MEVITTFPMTMLHVDSLLTPCDMSWRVSTVFKIAYSQFVTHALHSGYPIGRCKALFDCAEYIIN